MAQYLFQNGPMQTTTALVPVTTGTAIKTLLQVKLFKKGKVIRWGISFNGSAAAVPIRCELIETGTIFATVTTAVDADLSKYDDPNAEAASVAGFSLGTTSTGYTASGEGTIVATRSFDCQMVSPTNQYVMPFSLGQEPKINVATALRIRVLAPVAVDAYCYILLDI